MYGQGDGWTDKQWKKFDRAQRSAAKAMARRAGKMLKKADKLDKKGKTGGERLRGLAASLEKGAAFLQSNGDDGAVANGLNAEDYAKLPGTTEAGAAAAAVGSPTISVNLDRFFKSGMVPKKTWIVGHESLHSAGLEHQYGTSGIGKGKIAYKVGTPGQEAAFKELAGTPAADINPDHIMDEVY